MSPTRTLALAACIGLAAIAGCKSEKETTTSSMVNGYLTVQDTIDGSVTARVKSIDQANRTITISDGKGHDETFRVGPEVRRFNEIVMGDTIAIKYRAQVTAELRPPTPEEAANPITIVEIAGRDTASSATPRGAVAQGVKVVTTVEAVDRNAMLITLRGPLGSLIVVKGKNQENVNRVRIGETVVITYVESTVLTLDKANQPF